MINRVLQAKKEIDRINKKYADGIEELIPSEMESFCSYEMVTNKGTESLPIVCDDFKFKTIYLGYIQDLTFKSEYYKPQYGIDTKDSLAFHKELKEKNNQSENDSEFDDGSYQSVMNKAVERGFQRKATKAEIEKDIIYLNQIADKWKSTIDVTNHSDQKLKQASEETREIIREIKKYSKQNSISDIIKENDIKLDLWKTKYIHYQGLLIAEQIELENSLPYELKLNGKIIYFTYRSLLHILYRHFGQLVSSSYFQQTKSFHSPIFQPYKVHLILENIFARLSHSVHFKNVDLKHNFAYNFQFKDVDYQFYLKNFGDKKDKLRVSSVYPIENVAERKKLEDYELKTIDNELKVYKKL